MFPLHRYPSVDFKNSQERSSDVPTKNNFCNTSSSSCRLSFPLLERKPVKTLQTLCNNFYRCPVKLYTHTVVLSPVQSLLTSPTSVTLPSLWGHSYLSSGLRLGNWRLYLSRLSSSSLTLLLFFFSYSIALSLVFFTQYFWFLSILKFFYYSFALFTMSFPLLNSSVM